MAARSTSSCRTARIASASAVAALAGLGLTACSSSGGSKPGDNASSGSGGDRSPPTFRATWIGVMMSPQGNPHQPSASEEAVPISFDFVPQPLQHTCGLLFQDVIANADQTECAVWTSTGPGPAHFGQSP